MASYRNSIVTISYPILWDDPGPFSSQLNPDHAFLNLAMVLLYVPDRRAEETRLAFDDMPESWRVAVELESAGAGSGHRTGAYIAPTYDALVDAPVELGAFEEFRFEAGGRPIRVVIHGDPGDRSRLTDALKRIVEYESRSWAARPFENIYSCFMWGPSTAAEEWSMPTARRFPQMFPAS